MWRYSEDDLLAMAVQLFQDMGLCVEFEVCVLLKELYDRLLFKFLCLHPCVHFQQIPLQTLQQFVLQVRKNYHPNAFHNW